MSVSINVVTRAAQAARTRARLSSQHSGVRARVNVSATAARGTGVGGTGSARPRAVGGDGETTVYAPTTRVHTHTLSFRHGYIRVIKKGRHPTQYK